MSIAPLTITGVSQFSSDLQTILNRAVQIAQVPITQLQNRDGDLLQQKSLLGSLSSDTARLASALESLGSIATNRAVSATSSNTSAISILSVGSTVPTTYTIDSITSIAKAASERSVTAYADSSSTPVSSNGSMKLTVGSESCEFTLSTNTLVGLRDKINSLDAGVTASILTTEDGNYLHITSAVTGAAPIALNDDPQATNTSLLTSSNPGSDAEFQLNGITVRQEGNVVNAVVPGVTFQLLDASASATKITVATDRNKLSTALQSFVDAYNSLRTGLNAQVGSSAGLLSGNPIVTRLQQTLRQVVGYRNESGSVRSLADMGISFDTAGKASLDTAAFRSLSDSSITDAFLFLGSATENFAGYSRTLRQVSDPITGLIRAEVDGIDRTDKNIQRQISALTDRVSLMQTNLSRQLETADALLAQIESQQKAVTASLQGLTYVLYGKTQA
ncbi:MAG: flagellar filament capping protein FliD [Bryobacteraceae bacterium]